MRIGEAAVEVFRSLADFLFPPACLLCGAECPGGRFLCDGCGEHLSGRALTYEPHPRSIAGVTAVHVLLPYDPECRALVHAFKYRGMPTAARFAGTLLARKTARSLDGFRDAPVVPMPLHPRRLLERGYNQARELAEGFSSFSGNPIRDDLIARTTHTITQTALSAEERARNVRGAFAYVGDESLKGESVILMDDVLTTGSTVSECAGALAEGGAGSVAVLVVATPDARMD